MLESENIILGEPLMPYYVFSITQPTQIIKNLAQLEAEENLQEHREKPVLMEWEK